MPHCPDDFAHFPDVTSKSVEELLQDGPVVMDSERCSYLLEQQTATRCDWQRCEDAATFVGRRLSSRDGLYPIPTLRGERSDNPVKQLTGQRDLTEHDKQLGKTAGAIQHPTHSRDKSVPKQMEFRPGILDKLTRIRMMLMTAALCCCSRRHVERAAPTPPECENWAI